MDSAAPLCFTRTDEKRTDEKLVPKCPSIFARTDESKFDSELVIDFNNASWSLRSGPDALGAEAAA